MDENDVQNLICMENASPKARVIRSKGALYVMLLLLAIGSIAAANALEERLQIPREYPQIALYALLLGAGWYIYRFRLTTFRYTLTDRVFAIDRLTGQAERAEERILLGEILQVEGFANAQGSKTRLGAARNRSVLPRKKSSMILYRDGGEEYALLISPSEALFEQLNEQWQIAVQEKADE